MKTMQINRAEAQIADAALRYYRAHVKDEPGSAIKDADVKALLVKINKQGPTLDPS